jgi:carbamoyltransferase
MSDPDDTWVLGYSQSHNGAVCLLKGDRVVVAVQEERLTRVKRHFLSNIEESLALQYVLSTAGIRFRDLDMIVCCSFNGDREELPAPRRLRGVPHHTISHHLGHALGVFDSSGFDNATVLVVDGQGGHVLGLPESERQNLVPSTMEGPGNDDQSEIVSIYELDGLDVRLMEKHVGTWIHPRAQSELDTLGRMPSFGSLGGMYSAITQQIFGSIMDPGKVMGLAPYGEPVYPVSSFFEIVEGRFRFKSAVVEEFANRRERWPKNQSDYRNLAASVQQALEHALVHLLARARALSSSTNLCYAGGVALNSVANEKVVHRSGFENIYVMPAAEDSGPALGAAFYGLRRLRGTRPTHRIEADSMGRSYSSAEIDAAVRPLLPAIDELPVANLAADVAALLASGKSVGLFSGGSELGPRALGHRSILYDPRRADGKEVLNSRVKHREAFRPFAPAVLEEEVESWFQSAAGDVESPFMLRVLEFHASARERVPSVVHVDGTGRAQTVSARTMPLFHAILRAFHEETGVPVLLNTSLNVMGEPIVESPTHALHALLLTGLDVVVLENRIFRKSETFTSVLDLRPSVDVESLQLTMPVHGGEVEIAVGAETAVEVRTRTPWGTAKYTIGQRDVALLEVVDGRRSGHEILTELHGTHGTEPFERADVEGIIIRLARYGILRLAGGT